MSRAKAAGKIKKVWQCGHRDCNQVLNTPSANSHPKKGACPRHPNAKPRKVRQRVGGAIDWNQTRKDLRAKGIELRGAGADEAPGAYKRLPEVLEAHGNQIEVRHQLRPLGVAMASPDVVDPFKD